MASGLLYEVGQCYVDGHRELMAQLKHGFLGQWQVVLSEIGGRRIESTYRSESEARKALELAYAYGRQTGCWKIDRVRGYVPDESETRASPTGDERAEHRPITTGPPSDEIH